MARMTGSWLSGPNAAMDDDGTEQNFPGEKLGLPSDGPGAVAGLGRRSAALLVDWLMSMGIGALLLSVTGWQQSLSTVTLLVWFVVGVAAVTIFSFTPGQIVAGIQVARVDAAAKVGFVRALVRTFFIVFVFPAVISDHDGRGMHDRATGTAMLRVR
ncbi:RDD family protein [Rhodococcoides kyotonense]|uniref:RDD family protein n=1 Tax=Rhodococcoides kyotonense TaxID=398843 RepID=A0A239KYQ8_9NOCA|nr:RDD family protein [Rhodococcus kyotonensis]SNT23150.1 RDD family protein [Rhodococcus kyotonensis]